MNRFSTGKVADEQHRRCIAHIPNQTKLYNSTEPYTTRGDQTKLKSSKSEPTYQQWWGMPVQRCPSIRCHINWYFIQRRRLKLATPLSYYSPSNPWKPLMELNYFCSSNFLKEGVTLHLPDTIKGHNLREKFAGKMLQKWSFSEPLIFLLCNGI